MHYIHTYIYIFFLLWFYFFIIFIIIFFYYEALFEKQTEVNRYSVKILKFTPTLLGSLEKYWCPIHLFITQDFFDPDSSIIDYVLFCFVTILKLEDSSLHCQKIKISTFFKMYTSVLYWRK